MINSVYTSLSGLLAFSKGLDVISSNVSNLNTPGYKGNDLTFADLFYQHQSGGQNEQDAQIGHGVITGETNLRFRPGEIRSTGNNNELAIKGNGFFVLSDGINYFYTRAGEFDFDEDGFMVARGTKDKVIALNENGDEVYINVSDLRFHDPKATSEINLIGKLGPNLAAKTINDITLFDQSGDQHKIRLTLKNLQVEDGDPRTWGIEIRNEDNEIIFQDGIIRFKSDGTPVGGENSITFTFESEGIESFDVTLNFGDDGSSSGVTSNLKDRDSDIKVDKQDGYSRGALSELNFERDGRLVLKYTNGEEVKGDQIALAWTENIQNMQQVGGGRFVSKDPLLMSMGKPSFEGFGEIEGSSIELSNVELTEEFTDMIIIQRGYQASSQVMTVANEMMQQAIEMLRSR